MVRKGRIGHNVILIIMAMTNLKKQLLQNYIANSKIWWGNNSIHHLTFFSKCKRLLRTTVWSLRFIRLSHIKELPGFDCCPLKKSFNQVWIWDGRIIIDPPSAIGRNNRRTYQDETSKLWGSKRRLENSELDNESKSSICQIIISLVSFSLNSNTNITREQLIPCTN